MATSEKESEHIIIYGEKDKNLKTFAENYLPNND